MDNYLNNYELIGMDDTDTPNAKIFHYEGSLFIVVRSNAIVDVHYMIDVNKPLNYMGNFKSILSGNLFNERLTKFIDEHITIMMDKQKSINNDFKNAIKKEVEEL